MNLDTLCPGCMDNDSGEPTCPKCGSPFQPVPTDALQLPSRTLLRGQYLIGTTVAQSTFGITYLAWDRLSQTKIALKEYLPSGLAERSAGQTRVRPISTAHQEGYEFGLERFLEEAQSLKKLGGNPNIARVDSPFHDNGTAYLPMELLQGMTLQTFLESRDRVMSFENAQRILTPAIDALSFVHESGGLHGALSPSSIFLCKTGKIKLIGFGAARQALAKKTRNQTLLKEGYAAEEQYRQSGVPGPATDVYGLAATFYRAITGKVPPPALDRLAEDELQTPSQLGVQIPPSAEQALMKALSVRAAQRFQSVDEFRNGVTGSSVAGIPLPPPKAVKAAVPLPPPPASKAKSLSLFAPLALLTARFKSHKRLVTVALLALLALTTASAALHILAKHAPDSQDQQQASQQQPAAQSDQAGQGQADQPQEQQPDQNSEKNPPSQDTNGGQAAQPQPDPEPAPAPAPPQPVIRRAVTIRAAITPPPPAPVADPVVAPPPPVVAALPVGYDRLIARAATLATNGRYPEAADVLNHAIAVNPVGWQAYNALAKIQLYDLNSPNEAFVNYRAAIAHGGHASFRVRHNHGGEGLGIACSGWLNITHGRASFAADDSVHTFAFAPVKDARKNKFVGRIIGAEGGHAFHIRLINDKNYNFAPTSCAPKAEVDFILSVLG
jgi:serine/threonine protein kinase